MLPVESSATFVFEGHDPLNRAEVRLAECIVLRAMKTFPPARGFYGLTQISMTRLTMKVSPMSSVKQHPVHVVRTFVDRKAGERH
jgi:hypothetical protein